jgi:segregation and condensation protein A
VSVHYSVKTDVFEGPFDLLLSLIEKKKLLINDLSLATVTDEYVAYLNEQNDFPIYQASNFILTASTLLLIKSRSLLPILELSGDEAGDIDDLKRRLALYQRFKKIGQDIGRLYGERVLHQVGMDSRLETPIFSPSSDLTLENLAVGIDRVVATLPKMKTREEALVKEVVSIEEMIDRLTTRIEKSLSMSFKDFSSMDKAEKIEVVVSFLAMLELVKQGIIDVVQHERFADIEMKYEGSLKAPTYG